MVLRVIIVPEGGAPLFDVVKCELAIAIRMTIKGSIEDRVSETLTEAIVFLANQQDLVRIRDVINLDPVVRNLGGRQ